MIFFYHVQNCSYSVLPPLFLRAQTCHLFIFVTILNCALSQQQKVMNNKNTSQLVVPCNQMVLSFKSQIKKQSTLQHKTKTVGDKTVITQFHYNICI
jgi:cell division protein FtsL